MTLKGATIIDNACGGRRGTIVSTTATAALVLWPGGSYNEVDAIRDPGRYSIVIL